MGDGQRCSRQSPSRLPACQGDLSHRAHPFCTPGLPFQELEPDQERPEHTNTYGGMPRAFPRKCLLQERRLWGPADLPGRSCRMVVHQPWFSTRGLQARNLPCDAGTVLCVAPFLLPVRAPQISIIPVPGCSHLQHRCIPAAGGSHCSSHQEMWAGGGCLGTTPCRHVPHRAQAGRGMAEPEPAAKCPPAQPAPHRSSSTLSTGTGGRQGTQPQLHMDLQQSQEQVQVPQTPRSANSSQQRPEPGYAQRGLRDPYGPKQTLHYGADPTACPGQAAPALSLRGGCGGRSGATGTACMGTATLQPCSSRGDA